MRSNGAFISQLPCSFPSSRFPKNRALPGYRAKASSGARRYAHLDDVELAFKCFVVVEIPQSGAVLLLESRLAPGVLAIADPSDAWFRVAIVGQIAVFSTSPTMGTEKSRKAGLHILEQWSISHQARTYNRCGRLDLGVYILHSEGVCTFRQNSPMDR